MMTAIQNLLDYFQGLLGQKSAPVTTLIERGAVARFAEAVGDFNPLYRDEAYASANPNQARGPAYLAGLETSSEPGPAWESSLLPGDLRPGMHLTPRVRAPITTMQLVKFAAASNDFNPIHYDKDYALSSGLPGL